MIHCAKKRLADTVAQQTLRADLATFKYSKLSDLISAAVLTLPDTKLNTPEKRRINLLHRESMSMLYRLYHVVMNRPWAPPKPKKAATLRAGLRLYIL